MVYYNAFAGYRVSTGGFSSHGGSLSYIPLIGLFISIIWGLYALSIKFRIDRKVFYSGITGILLTYSTLTLHQVAVWKNNDSLYNHTISVTQENWLAHLNYGESLFQKGELDAAIDQYKKALQIKPDFANAYNDMGVAMAHKNQLNEAIFFYKKAISFKKNMPTAWVNLESAYFRMGLMNEALAHYKKTIFYDVNSTSAYCGIGVVMDAVGNWEKALKAFKMVLAIDPGSMFARNDITEIEKNMAKTSQDN